MALSLSTIWFIVGISFIVSEFIIPGLIIVFFGIGALITALATKVFDISITIQVILFICSSLSLLFSVRHFLPKTFLGNSDTGINDYDKSILGKKGIVTEEINKGQEGQIKFQGSFWRASSTTHIPVETSITIVGKDSEDPLLLTVKM